MLHRKSELRKELFHMPAIYSIALMVRCLPD